MTHHHRLPINDFLTMKRHQAMFFGGILCWESPYEKGVILSKSVMRAIEKRLKRNPELPKWDILIEPMAAA
jgi:hypothetical protein